MKNVFRLSLLALMFVCLPAGLKRGVASAQTPTPTATPSPTPDPFVTQITSSKLNAFVGGISGNGRFVVFESTADLATLHPGQITRSTSNTDGNREIFLYDYAQRRIFQLTDTTVARADTTKPAINATSATDFSNVEVEISNNRPVISRDGRWIVFSSNADTPFSFNGDTNKAALKLDGNQEIFLYRIPDAAAVDLRSGTDTPFVDLRQNAFTRITNTAASRLPTAGTAATTTNPPTSPFVADDNRMAQLNDRGSRIVFVSTRNELTAKNADFNPEIFVWRRTSGVEVLPATGSFTQLTNTSGPFTFNDNPSISGDTASDEGAEDPRSIIAFISNATVMRDASDAIIPTTNTDANAEIFVTNFNGATTTAFTQATRTRRGVVGDLVNIFNSGQRVSRDGRFIAFESVATDPGADAATNPTTSGMFVYSVASGETRTFLQVGPRAATDEGDVPRFPVFTGDSRQLVFTSALNFTPGGTRVDQGAATGLNPAGFIQIYSVPIPDPLTAPQSFTRLTNITGGQAATQHFVSNTTERIAFSFGGELGGGNGTATAEVNSSVEAFYLNVPPAPPTSNTPASASALTFFTGASEREVVPPPATPTPTPSPAPSATPITGLAPGMLGIVRAPAAEGSVRFAATATGICAPEDACVDAASESHRSPSLPVELGGVSLSVNNTAAGLYFVSPTEIQFVLPIGLTAQTGTATSPIVININEGGAVRTIRSVLQIVPAQPDIFTRPEAPTRARVFNVTTGTLMDEPADGFPVTTDAMGTAKPTILAIFLTGVRNPAITRANVTVTIGDRTITGNDIQPAVTGTEQAFIPTGTPGMDQLNVQLRADLAGLGDQPLVVSVTVGGVTFTSRPAATAPRIRIR